MGLCSVRAGDGGSGPRGTCAAWELSHRLSVFPGHDTRGRVGPLWPHRPRTWRAARSAARDSNRSGDWGTVPVFGSVPLLHDVRLSVVGGSGLFCGTPPSFGRRALVGRDWRGDWSWHADQIHDGLSGSGCSGRHAADSGAAIFEERVVLVWNRPCVAHDDAQPDLAVSPRFCLVRLYEEHPHARYWLGMDKQFSAGSTVEVHELCDDAPLVRRTVVPVCDEGRRATTDAGLDVCHPSGGALCRARP